MVENDVTNEQFQKFVEATGYVTTEEKSRDLQ
jgi:formylglycine-generating enzyme required for sulfatase activity